MLGVFNGNGGSLNIEPVSVDPEPEPFGSLGLSLGLELVARIGRDYDFAIITSTHSPMDQLSA
jgi:hypothetical protein